MLVFATSVVAGKTAYAWRYLLAGFSYVFFKRNNNKTVLFAYYVQYLLNIKEGTVVEQENSHKILL